MPVEFHAPSPSPARVHENSRALTGHHPCWLKHEYRGGLYSTAHFRVCSYCRCIHPGDLIDLLEAGETSLVYTTKSSKFWVMTPNPIAGDLVQRGSVPGKIFEGMTTYFPAHRRLVAEPRWGINPTISERLTGHYDRPMLEPAPVLIKWPFYLEHTTERQWPEIEAAVTKGENEHASFQTA